MHTTDCHFNRLKAANALQLPKFDNIHTLSVSRSAINAITFSKAGDWVALGCAALGQVSTLQLALMIPR